MPLCHRPHKMCEYQADAVWRLDEEMLLYRLRELVQPKHVRAEEHVAMGTHDFPPLEVRQLLHFYLTTYDLSNADNATVVLSSTS